MNYFEVVEFNHLVRPTRSPDLSTVEHVLHEPEVTWNVKHQENSNHIDPCLYALMNV